MTKTLDVLADAVHGTKPQFRQVDARPEKPKKHRYERRKVRECLRTSDLSEEIVS